MKTRTPKKAMTSDFFSFKWVLGKWISKLVSISIKKLVIMFYVSKECLYPYHLSSLVLLLWISFSFWSLMITTVYFLNHPLKINFAKKNNQIKNLLTLQLTLEILVFKWINSSIFWITISGFFSTKKNDLGLV